MDRDFGYAFFAAQALHFEQPLQPQEQVPSLKSESIFLTDKTIPKSISARMASVDIFIKTSYKCPLVSGR